METYEQKYKEALERAKNLHKDAIDMGENIRAKQCEIIFPELAESEGERIRKEIMDFIDTKTIDSDERRNRWFSYLEKYKPISFTSLEDTKIKMSLMQYISELNQDVVHLHPGIETCNEWIAWLEKQGQKPYGQRKECLDCQFNYAGECKGSCAMKRSERKPTEWSEEDEVELNGLIKHYEDGHLSTPQNRKTIKWLKNIKQRIGG